MTSMHLAGPGGSQRLGADVAESLDLADFLPISPKSERLDAHEGRWMHSPSWFAGVASPSRASPRLRKLSGSAPPFFAGDFADASTRLGISQDDSWLSGASFEPAAGDVTVASQSLGAFSLGAQSFGDQLIDQSSGALCLEKQPLLRAITAQAAAVSQSLGAASLGAQSLGEQSLPPEEPRTPPQATPWFLPAKALSAEALAAIERLPTPMMPWQEVPGTSGAATQPEAVALPAVMARAAPGILSPGAPSVFHGSRPPIAQLTEAAHAAPVAAPAAVPAASPVASSTGGPAVGVAASLADAYASVPDPAPAAAFQGEGTQPSDGDEERKGPEHGHCAGCRDLQRQLMDLSVCSAKSHTERHEAMKAARHIHEARAGAEAEAAALACAQAELADRLQVAEQALEELELRQADTEKLWREEASSWQSAQEEAKIAAGRAQSVAVDAEESAMATEAEVQCLRQTLQKSLLELEDVRTACGATERRVAGDSVFLEEEVSRAKAASTSAQRAAESARARATSVEAQLAAAEAQKANAVPSRLFAERKRCKDLEVELTEWQQRVEAGRAALKRLCSLREEATLRLETSTADAKSNAVACRDEQTSQTTEDSIRSPQSSGDQAAAARALRLQLREREYQVGELETEHLQLRRLQQLDAERHAAKTERLREKAERYRAGHADLQRLYLARRATAA
mmetsp:Transcript_32315/g.57178  ORF Transcript_32315/g.57178 Transcript_32315/m.57178 type:complete len:687 (+) Transcript_32315:36-2096(+)